MCHSVSHEKYGLGVNEDAGGVAGQARFIGKKGSENVIAVDSVVADEGGQEGDFMAEGPTDEKDMDCKEMKTYCNDVLWGSQVDFKNWELWTRSSFGEAAFVSALLRWLLRDMSFAYWNIHQKSWGIENGEWFPVVMGEITFSAEDDYGWKLSFHGVSLSWESGKIPHVYYIRHSSRSAADWVRWFLEFRLEIRRHNLCIGYCEEHHALKDCPKSLAKPEYEAEQAALNLVV